MRCSSAQCGTKERTAQTSIHAGFHALTTRAFGSWPLRASGFALYFEQPGEQQRHVDGGVGLATNMGVSLLSLSQATLWFGVAPEYNP